MIVAMNFLDEIIERKQKQVIIGEEQFLVKCVPYFE